MPSLRIAIIRQRYRPDGGGERFVARTMDALAAQGASLVIAAREWPEQSGGPRVLRCDPFYVGALWRDIGFAQSVRRRLRTESIDIVQSHERIPYCDIFRAGDGLHREWLLQRARIQGPLERFGVLINPYHRYVLWAESTLLRNPRLRAVICGSRMVREEITRHFGPGSARIEVIYNGVDTREFNPDRKNGGATTRDRLGIPRSMTLFVFVGSGFVRKGLSVALAALSQLPATCGLLVVGQDKRQRRFQKECQRLGIAARVWFVGRQADPIPYYAAADAAVLPALYDPSPNVILEALAIGIPVLASTKCGTSELLQDGLNGYVRDALDVSGFAAAMTAILMLKDRRPMAEAARASVIPCDLEHMAQRLIAFYHELAGSQ